MKGGGSSMNLKEEKMISNMEYSMSMKKQRDETPIPPNYSNKEICPDCGMRTFMQGRCPICLNCGWSPCQ
jgi:hypothetical protein